MTWKPTKLTREQMEERRLEGGRLLKEGKLSKAEIARHLGVTRGSVTAWAKVIKAGGLRRLRQRKSSGRRSKLTGEIRRKLKRLLDCGALVAGFPTDRWTLVRVSELIKKEFDINYHPNSLRRVLDQMGYSVQKPLARVAERDEKLVKAWLEKDWPRIKKSAAARRNHRVLR
jgi:putative transposase